MHPLLPPGQSGLGDGGACEASSHPARSVWQVPCTPHRAGTGQRKLCALLSPPDPDWPGAGEHAKPPPPLPGVCGASKHCALLAGKGRENSARSSYLQSNQGLGIGST